MACASLRKACPCLETVCIRLFGDTKNVPGADKDTRDESESAKPVDLDDGRAAPRYTVTRQALLPPHCAEKAVYTALWAFDAREEQELSFEAGDVFHVISRSGEWWSARKIDANGRVLATGIVPHNYLARGDSVDAQPWYFGQMNRFEALSHLLSPENAEGAFLIRLSEKNRVGYVLSVKSNERARHFKVVQTEGQFYLEQNRLFPSLMDLVEFYGSHCLGTVERLDQPCVRMQPQPQDLSSSTVDEWELPKDEFTLGEQLGSGNFADVYQGRWKDRISVAVKVLKNDELNHTEFQREVQILKRLRHRHLISLFAVCTATPPFYIITEIMEKGNLLNFMRGGEAALLDQVSLVDMSAQVADGMCFLEEQRSIHRDLAARNVLVGKNYICKVADFGLARVIKEPFYISEDRKIPYKWSAPEAISHGRFSNKSDVWSFGVLLYEIFSYGGVPYPAFSNIEVYNQVTKGYRMPPPANCPDFLYDIMLLCWAEAPSDRPDFKDLKPRLENVNVNRYELE